MPPLIPPVYFFAGIAASFLLHFLFPVARLINFPLTLVGFPYIVVALWIGLQANRLFKKHGTALKPGEPSTKLVLDGPFKFSRNPMYLGMVVLLIGLAIMLGTLTPWIVPVYMFMVLNFGFVVHEEKQMRKTFGKEYEDYCSRVRRWV